MESPVGSHNTSAQQEEPPAMEEVAPATAHGAQDSAPSNFNAAATRSHSSADALNHENHTGPHLDLSGRLLSPVIYTKHHFEDLKLGALQYAKETIERHEELGVVITQRDMNRHWRKQVKREYNESHPLWSPLLKQVMTTQSMTGEDAL